MSGLYTFMVAEAEELVRREAELDPYNLSRENYKGMLIMFDRLEEGMFLNGLLDRRESQHIRAVTQEHMEDRFYRGL